MPDLTGRNAAIAADEFADLGLTQVVFRSGNPKYSAVVAPENWTVTGIEPAVGTPVDLEDTLVVTVTKP